MASVKIRTNKSKSGVLTYYLAHYTNIEVMGEEELRVI